MGRTFRSQFDDCDGGSYQKVDKKSKNHRSRTRSRQDLKREALERSSQVYKN